ncbi:type II toxin-antitoxin system CcdA family antitoxin [Cribrihabitans pelagius]|uniref:type II toxin-antitoxin system CcdA family antitoxin n=1 Tax=Cribrihabitans pelagius TaxID=1765746 RepID=UPI003B5A0ED9
MPQQAPDKKRTNVTLNAANLTKAREFGLNVSAISDAALAEAVALAEPGTDRNAGYAAG